ncbi:winged helix-turn-helix transcriptional regulator [Peptostreptococcus anaerobius]|uniref:Winged helix-turn-helix transcriptional regulator n=1 Tax=Peptostreptococcus porci TaxID=2652282 RepID=A0A6N7WYC6_9FIRM|nr:winged helix-turn-helix transcriptional regulator [Peptostreptococcus porci]
MARELKNGIISNDKDVNDLINVDKIEVCVLENETDIEVCDIQKTNDKLVEEIKRSIPRNEVLDDLSELFKVFGDITRIKIIYAIKDNEMCVCDIAKFLGMSQSAISHQLRVLKKARLVKYRREGKTVYYSLDDEHVNKIFEFGLSHVNEMYY